MFHARLLILSILFSLTSAIFFDVKRYAADPKDGNEPYRPINYFLNKQRKRSICLFMFCWSHYGNCRSSTDCCECKCKNRSTYFSEPLGCKEGRDMTNMTKDVGKGCYFATKKFGFNYVPLFHNHSRFVDVELDLPRRNFPLNDETTSCKVAAIYDHDYHGHKLLFNRNRCSELFQVRQKQGKQYLQFLSTNVSIWNSFRGRLLSVDISCYSQRASLTFSSCFLFQVEGKYNEEVDGEEPPEIPAGYACPSKNAKTNSVLTTMETTPLVSTTTNAATLGITSMGSTSMGNTSTQSNKQNTISTTSSLRSIRLKSITAHKTLQSTAVHRTKLPTTGSHTTTFHSTTFPSVTKQPNVIKTTTKAIKEEIRSPKSTKVTVIFLDANDSLTGTTIGILTGLGTGLAVVMICVVIWILIKKRKYLFMSQQSMNTPILSPEVNPSDDNNGYHYDVPNVNVKSIDVIPDCCLPNGHGSYNFAPMNDDISLNGFCRQYSYIGEKVDMDDDQCFENRENTFPLKSRGTSGSMSKRPLPEKPMESGNPYYSVASLPTEQSDKASEGNDMYSLYSTIEDLKGS